MSNNPLFIYKNITISGLPGAGSTTLLHKLREALDKNWQAFSGGEFMRAWAAEHNYFDNNDKFHHSSIVYGEEFDKEVDMGMRHKLETEKNWILESWLSGFVAQQVPGVLKVLLDCSNDSVRIDRIVNRDTATVEEAKKHISARYQENLTKWSRLYTKEWQKWVVEPGTLSANEPIDFWRPELYDVVIDTYSTNQDETLKQVLDALKKKTPSSH
ncbi:MAG: hypothetical protein A2383_00870 [Candidatus Pacebacteria bacterium RIFOXYB1_FULL_39_46]|nr:MAG: hypothetical protein A2182_00705 [Candidatus Pacebacteria bacterium RIFOXYA1_FULL_38_18]OGJ38135.1 MAG: hypothetical protein A2383_00870 [Candidatus Pacebacteria bacterium RIFOXYB1_FULL_39_46]OGJ39643.1 MAG: hypothetical protein A2411_02570 [Candidatus Pacebacteria bacterium RIFOXYC1_FULL_39_21]OGJ39887.1 MAG: hypothetical protein A2582_00635 [Candidatus Pacebacteria bacterium RIFOXYD1_FULL_39_27]